MKSKMLPARPTPARLTPRAARLLRWLAVVIFLSLVILDFYRGAVLMNNPPSFNSKRFALFWGAIFPLILLAFFYSLLSVWKGREPLGLLARLTTLRARLPFGLRLALGIVLLVLPAMAFMWSPVGAWPLGYWSRLGAVVMSGWLAALLLESAPGHPALLRRVALILLAGALFTTANWLSQVTAYPFSLYWSEGNRFYDYSVLFSGHRYTLEPGSQLVKPLTSRGRQLLWGLPFLLPNPTLWLMRLWDALLYILPALLLGWVSVVGLREPGWSWAKKGVFMTWMLVFFSQGPIYAPLLVAAALVVLAVRCKMTPVSMALVAAAGYFAWLGRWTWMYAPGLWAGMLALLNIASPSLRPARWKELLRPIALGLAGYVGGQFLPRLPGWFRAGGASNIQLVVDISDQVGKQPLLWERMFPNVIYAPGILLGILWAGLPLLALLVLLAARKTWPLNRLQALAVAGIALAFMAVGIVASAKIGGGSNLHNLDMLWVTLALAAAWAARDVIPRGWPHQKGGSLAVLALCAALLGPVTYTVRYGAPLERKDPVAVQEALSEIRARVAQAAQTGPVLFIDQRQLLAFGLIPDVPLISEYEKKVLMDHAMAGNSGYFERFHADLAAQKFVLIVSEPLHAGQRNASQNEFAQENNAWVKWVSQPVLDRYEPLETYSLVGVQLLVPKEPTP